MSAPSTFQTLRGKVAIVTGASRGLGYGFALELARRGAKIVAAYTSDSSAAGIDALKAEIASVGGGDDDPGPRCVGVKADLRRRDGAAEIVSAAVAAFGPRVDVLVNNAAAELVRPTAELTPGDFAHVYELNVLAPLLLVQQVMPYLPCCPSPEGEGSGGGEEEGGGGGGGGGGRIINIGSVGARQGLADLSLYCSSKAALEGLTRCWAEELGGAGHTVNCANPGPVRSRMLDQIPHSIKERQRLATPAGRRFGTVGDVAGVVAWLAGEDSRWVTGQCICASGGYAMY